MYLYMHYIVYMNGKGHKLWLAIEENDAEYKKRMKKGKKVVDKVGGRVVL